MKVTSLESHVKPVLGFLCPLTQGQSFEDFASIILLFPDFKNSKQLIALGLLYLTIVGYFIDGFFYSFIDTYYLPLPRDALGPLLHPLHLMVGLVAFEIILLRSYGFLTLARKGEKSSRWFQIVTTIERGPKFFQILRYVFFQLYVSFFLIIVVNKLTKLVERATLSDCILNTTWLLIELFNLRSTSCELPLFYIMSSTCFYHVNQKLKDLLNDCRQQGLSANLIVKYIHIVNSIQDVNPLMKLISFTSGLLILPFIGLVIIFTITETENEAQFIFKYVYLIPSFIYAVRGVVMTTVLARIESKSRLFHKLIASRIARGQFNGPVSMDQLNWILEDLSCSRNHISIREYSGSLCNQMDVMMYVIAIAQFVMLLMEFSFKVSF